jgi:hypothetical protein
VRCPGPGIVAVLIGKACRAVVRRCRCRCRLGRPGGRPAEPAHRAASGGWRGGARSRAGDPAAGRRDGAAAAGRGALPVLQAHAHPAADLARAPPRRCHRGDRHPTPAARYAPDMVADPAMRAVSAAFPAWCAVSLGLPFAAGWGDRRQAGTTCTIRPGLRPPWRRSPADRNFRCRHPHLRAPGLGYQRALAHPRPPGAPLPRSGSASSQRRYSTQRGADLAGTDLTVNAVHSNVNNVSSELNSVHLSGVLPGRRADSPARRKGEP